LNLKLHRLIKVKCSKAPNRVGIGNSTDYSPFGVELDGRTVSGGYRYGFQNQEKDDEIKGEGNSINYTFRMHDPRLGRFFAVDPLAAKFTGWSPYAFCNDNPIMLIDKDGREPTPPDWYKDQNGNVQNWEESTCESFTEYWLEIDRNGNTIASGDRYWTKIDPPNQPEMTSGSGATDGGVGNSTSISGNEIIDKVTTIVGETAKGLDGVSMGDNGMMYKHFNGNQYVKTSALVDKSVLKPIGDAAPIVGNVMDAKELYDSWVKDGRTFGDNTIIQGSGVLGGAAGGSAGAEAGALIGAEIGVWFGGVGAIPSAVIGGILGGIFGSWAGEAATESAVESVVK